MIEYSSIFIRTQAQTDHGYARCMMSLVSRQTRAPVLAIGQFENEEENRKSIQKCNVIYER
jgi:hypothetical protein